MRFFIIKIYVIDNLQKPFNTMIILEPAIISNKIIVFHLITVDRNFSKAHSDILIRIQDRVLSSTILLLKESVFTTIWRIWVQLFFSDIYI